MTFSQKEIELKDGLRCVLRSPAESDAEGMMEYLKTCAFETDFILRYPEECIETAEQERKFLQGINESEFGLMIVGIVDREIAGNCQISFSRRMKTAHRASVAIAIVKKYWGLGLGSAMFEELIGIARKRGIMLLELEFIEGNVRARALYEKMGFSIVAVRPDAIRLRDGTMLKEYIMVKRL